MFLLLWAAAACAPARAGAFLQPPGAGLVIAQFTFSEADRYFDAYGRVTPIRTWRKFDLSTYAEYGLTDAITIMGSPDWFSFHAPAPTQSRTGAGAQEVGARVRLAQWGDNILSAQASARFLPGGRRAALFSDASHSVQADVRLLYGRNTTLFERAAFIDVQMGFRSSGAFGPQARLDMSYGWRVFKRVVLLLQAFSVVTPGKIGERFALSQKAQASVLYDLTDKITLQIGAMIAPAGVRAPAERAVIAGVWTQF
ncbi:MAG: hypothetical protein KGL46_11770 [Hyphomicrobiales bacterium]|nr:hypothetical protein [Hyphomicrobiales bacterium]